MQKIGIIYGEIIGEKFYFATKDYYKGDFVKIREDESVDDSPELICEIISRGVSNPFFTTPEVVRYFDDNMDYKRDTIYTYTVCGIGVIKNGVITSDRVTAMPGKNVYTVDKDLLKIVYGIGSEGQKIGYLKKMPNCEVMLDVNKILNPHLFIVGKTGSGKSYFTTGLLSRIDETFWVFSPTDEYNDLDTKAEYQTLSDFTLELKPEDISYYVDLNTSEELILKNIKFQEDKEYTYSDIINEIQNYYKKKSLGQMTLDEMMPDLVSRNSADIALPQYANSLINKLKNIRHLKFTKNRKLITTSKDSLVFDLGEYTQLEQECILNYYLFNLLQRSKRTNPANRKKHIIVIEEAHNFVPSVRNTLSKSIIVRLSREGRKYGVSLCFITQRPRFFDQTALSQSGNRIIFSLPNPDDVRHIMEDVPFYKPELAMSIQSQRVGECIIAGDAFNDILETIIKYDE